MTVFNHSSFFVTCRRLFKKKTRVVKSSRSLYGFPFARMVPALAQRRLHIQSPVYNNIKPTGSLSPSTTAATTTTTTTIPKKNNSLVEDFETTFAKTLIFNEQFADNDDSKPLKVAISRNACNQLQKLMAEDKNSNLAVQVTVESGGCHGFQYHLKLIDLFQDKVIKKDLNQTKLENLTVDDLNDDETSIFNRDGAKVVLDNSSLLILRESKVDYVKELIGTSFKVIDSPYTKSACGCGSSFDVDFSKLEKLA